MESFPLKQKLSVHARAFTLVEMIVVLSIISILTVIVVVGQTSFNKSNLLTDTAYTVALSMRETQTLGLSSRTFSSVPNAGFGVHFGDSTAYYDQFADIYPAAPGTSSVIVRITPQLLAIQILVRAIATMIPLKASK